MDQIDSIYFNAIFADGSYKKYATLEQATVPNPVNIIKSVSGYWENGKYLNAKCEFKIFDSEGKEVNSIEVGNWSLTNLKVTTETNQFQRTKVYFEIIDPNGVITIKDFGHGFSAIITAFKYLTEISSFENIENVQLLKENEKLKSQIERLNEKLKALESK